MDQEIDSVADFLSQNPESVTPPSMTKISALPYLINSIDPVTAVDSDSCDVVKRRECIFEAARDTSSMAG